MLPANSKTRVREFKRMNKAKLVEAFAQKNNLTKTHSEKILNILMDTIQKTLKKGEEVKISGFGKWYVSSRNPRVSKNPHTGEAMQVAAFKTPAFKASKSLKNLFQS